MQKSNVPATDSIYGFDLVTVDSSKTRCEMSMDKFDVEAIAHDDSVIQRIFRSVFHREQRGSTCFVAMVVMLGFGWGVGASQAQHIETNPATTSVQRYLTYESRYLKRRDVHKMDPNVYAYSKEFAQRFSMPMEWVSDELEGAEAVAFRVVPTYKLCGWNGDPTKCLEDNVTCRLDVYFDQQRHPLPWNKDVPPIDFDISNTSATFIHNAANLFARPFDGNDETSYYPFKDEQSGKKIRWQYFSKIPIGNRALGYIRVASYDREIFRGLSLVTFALGCDSPHSIWLADISGQTFEVKTRQDSIVHVAMPLPWQLRVQDAAEEGQKKSREFTRIEGEKALIKLKNRRQN